MKTISKRLLTALTVIILALACLMTCSAVKDDRADNMLQKAVGEECELSISGDSINVAVRKTTQLTAEVTGVAQQPEITWTSSDTSVATVEANGLVKGIAVGRAVITATATVEGEILEAVYAINVVTRNNFAKSFLEKNQILSYKYSYVDDYYYTNDKKCWQSNFGYARIYDLVAPYIALEYDYLRVFFTYEDLDYMVQLWKGQYGYLFYGSEIGIYTKPADGKDVRMMTFYDCAGKEEWAKMEMTLYHQNIKGEWVREFTRDYDEYWWCTGFKPGHLRMVEPADELRMVAKMTFREAKITKLFTLGLKACGLTRAKNVDSIGLDNYYRKGDTVYFCWQDISEAENTMPIKIAAGAVIAFNILAAIIGVLLILGMLAPLGLLVFIII